MANPAATNPPTAKVPKIIQNTKFKVRTNVLETTHDEIPTTSVLPSYSDRNIHFKINRASGKCINISLMKLHLQFTLQNPTHLEPDPKKEDEEATNGANTKPKAIVPGNPFGSMFKDVRIKLNNVPVTQDSGLFPYISQHLFLTKIQPTYRQMVEESGMIYYDYEATKMMPKLTGDNYHKVGLNSSKWQNLGARQEKYEIGATKAIDICGYLFTDLTASPQAVVVPPSVDVDVELVPNSPRRSIILDKVGTLEPVIVVTKANIIVPRVTPAATIPRSMSYQFLRVTAQPIFISAQKTNYHGITTYAGDLPSRLSLVFASMGSYDGNYSENIYASKPHNVKQISFNVAGKIYPSSPVTADFVKEEYSEMYLRSCEALRFSLNQTGRKFPSMNDYSLDQFLFCADLSDDYSVDNGNWATNMQDTGSIAISIQFAEPLKDQVVAILITESVSTLKITQAGEVEVD